MAASVFDSPLYAQLFPTGEVERLFSDSATVRAMLLVEGALAKVQGAQGVIPELSAAAIHRASMEVQIDAGALAEATGQNGVSVPGLVAAFRAAMNAPEHAQYVHWGATSQDIIDTGLMLRLRQYLTLAEDELRSLIKALSSQAETHADTPMVARTYAQQATPTSFGAVCADWGQALADALEGLTTVREASLWVSLSGAAGTASALGPDAAQTRAALAQALGLRDPARSWHVDRGPIARIADWSAGVTATLGRMGATLVALTSTEVAEVSLGAAGASSTMPQKQNPVAPSALQALGHQMAGLRAALQPALQHQHQRDGAAWFTEWMVLPQICLSTACALILGRRLAETARPDVDRMADNIAHGQGLIHAEALSFALASVLSRPDAQARTKALCQQAGATGQSLETLARAEYPDLPADLFDAKAQMGLAPEDARAFVARAKAL